MRVSCIHLIKADGPRGSSSLEECLIQRKDYIKFSMTFIIILFLDF